MTPLINEGESELTAGTYVSTVSQCSSCHNTSAVQSSKAIVKYLKQKALKAIEASKVAAAVAAAAPIEVSKYITVTRDSFMVDVHVLILM